ncbi:MAG: sulfurtransferase [Rhodospirillaceae bacterium]
MRIPFAAILGILLAVSPAAAQTPPASQPLLVSTEWLADHLRDPNLVTLQTSQAPAVSEQIPGARLVSHDSLMTMIGGAHDLADPASLVAALERAGVSNSSHVVIYGEPMAAGWLFFALEYLGHERVSLLDGGLDKWIAERRAVTAVSVPPSSGRFQPEVRPQVKSSADAIQNRNDTVAVVDARSQREYAAGHIPGARLLSWQDVYADAKLQVFKSPEDIAALFNAAGAAPGKTAITYCQIGLRSSLLYFAARYAGLNASNYVGSWSEWSARGLPTETAPD